MTSKSEIAFDTIFVTPDSRIPSACRTIPSPDADIFVKAFGGNYTDDDSGFIKNAIHQYGVLDGLSYAIHKVAAIDPSVNRKVRHEALGNLR